jgi:trehalose 6-phosphate synthase
VRYIHRMVARKRLPGLCRAAAVGLDAAARRHEPGGQGIRGAQDPDNPGVLVLSRFAGAAEQLKEALLVNPYDPQGMADSIQQALQMPLAERQARHQKLMARIKEHDVHWWRKAFMDALQAAAD